MILKDNFVNLLSKIGFEGNGIQKEWAFLEKAYSAKNRHYHNLEHIQAMLFIFNEFEHEIYAKDEMQYAIFYHDIVYKATNKNNEKDSADYALKILPKNTHLNAQLVYDAILATKTHTHNNKDIRWLLDFDLEILGRSWEMYLEYSKQIRKEYKIYPNFMYKPGRKKALQHFLKRERIYHSESFFEKYENQARQNIKNEIASL